MAAKKSIARSIDGISRPPIKRSRIERLKRSFKRSRLLRVSSILLSLAIIAGCIITVHNLYKHPNYNDPATVLNALSKHIVLPTGEKPLIATVTDRSALKTPFLKEANNGDRIIIYEKAKRAIIYRQSIDRIIDIGPVELSNIPKAN